MMEHTPYVTARTFWVSIVLAILFTIGIGNVYNVYRIGLTSDSLSYNSRSDRILNNLMRSWIPDRVTSEEAGVIAEPFSARFGFFPDTVIHLAKISQDSSGVPAPVTLAQWALESGFGRNGIGDHNYFGMTFAAVKSYMSVPRYVIAWDRRLIANGKWQKVAVKFAKFRNIYECFMVHGKYIEGSDLYSKAQRAWSTGHGTRNTEKYVREIAKHYAEDPEYATKLMAIIERYNLDRIGESAKGENGE